MRKTKRWHKLWLIIPAFIIFPPLGIFMLWRSPRKLAAKFALSIVLLLIAGGVYVGAYENFKQPTVPAEGYDITRNAQGYYRNPKILPLEKEVFGAIVREMRHKKPEKTEDSYESIFLDVSDQFGLNYEDTRGIYLKVISQLSLPLK